ncbi:hypothetical protein AB0H57_05600 [Micromonospora sp. NPDC050686]|uniref:hypothetical protein n=1 Tax=Micromonospora sp. NPDC050686 TaxID=3154631 RepID=UPI0034040998
MNRLRLFFGWPGPRWVFPAAGTLMATASLLATRDIVGSDYVTWSAVATAWHESLWIPGSVVAGAAAALGATYFPKASPVAAALRPRVDAGLFLVHGLALAVWLCLGHALGLAPIHLAAARQATTGALAIQDVVVGVAGVTTLAVIGLCVGAAVRHWVIAPAVAVLAFAVMGLPNEPLFMPIGLLLPVRQWTPSSPRFETNSATAVFAVIASIGICLLAASLASWAASRGSVRRRGRPLLTWLAVVGALAAIAFAWRPALTVVDRPVPRVCQQVDGTEVCLHAANRPAMDRTVAVVARLRAAGLAPMLSRVTDVAVSDHDTPRAKEALISLDPSPLDRRFLAATIPEQVALQVSEAITLGNCLQPGQTTESYDTATVLYARILQLAGFEDLAGAFGPDAPPAAARKLTAMNAAQLGAFVQHNQEMISSCRLSAALG